MKIYIVQGECGEYSDRSQWIVKAFKDKKKADFFVERIELLVPTIRQNYYDNEDDFEKQAIFLCDFMKSELKHLDPDLRCYYDGSFEHWVEEVELK